jgi:hypothetical protein
MNKIRNTNTDRPIITFNVPIDPTNVPHPLEDTLYDLSEIYTKQELALRVKHVYGKIGLDNYTDRYLRGVQVSKDWNDTTLKIAYHGVHVLTIPFRGDWI